MAKVKAVLYLPLRDNDGRDLTDAIGAVEMELYLRFVGWTFQGYVKGMYRMADGSPCLDESAVYAVVLDEARLDELEEVVLEFKHRTSQEALYLEIHRAVEVRFL